MNHVFISYYQKNASDAQRLSDQLTAYGDRVWIDPKDVAPGI